MLRYKDSTIPLIGRFFRHRNEIDIFVEDLYDEQFYAAIFNRIGTHLGRKIEKVIAVGSRQKVIDACLTDQEPRDRKRLYIIDGDLYHINDNNPKGINHLFVHKKYCIENYLINEDALIEILHDQLVVPKDDITKNLTYSNFLKFLSTPLVDLFLHYGLVQEICPQIKTVAEPVGKLCRQVNKVHQADIEKVNHRIAFLKEEILKVISEEEYNEKIYGLRKKWPDSVETLLEIVSAKDYIIPLTHLRLVKLKRLGNPSISTKSLRLRLAKLVPIENYKDITEKISNI